MGAYQIKTRRFWFRLLLLWSGSFPIFYGASAMLSGNTWETVEYTLFQTKVERTPELDFALKRTGQETDGEYVRTQRFKRDRMSVSGSDLPRGRASRFGFSRKAQREEQTKE
jgi:hypothetical protein